MSLESLKLRERIKERAAELGFEDCRVTGTEPLDEGRALLEWLRQGNYAGMEWMRREPGLNSRLNPACLLPGAKSVICLARSYCSDSEEESPYLSGIARYAWVKDYHYLLKKPLEELARFVDEYTPRGVPAAVCCTDSHPVLERALAQRAGIGVVGWHNNLISPKLGNYFFLAEVITCLELPEDEPLSEEFCSCVHCGLCLRACPTGALEAPYRLNARRCLSYLTIEHRGEISPEFHSAMGERFMGCDRCLEACPWSRINRRSTLPRWRLPEEFPENGEDFSLEDFIHFLEGLSNRRFQSLFKDSSLSRPGKAGLLRNLRIALSNSRT